MCFQLQIFSGGVLAVDVTDPDCSSDTFNATKTISTFKNITNDRVYYHNNKGDLGWSGYFDFKETDMVNDTDIGFPVFDFYKLKFGVEIFLPDCYSDSPSIGPSG